MIDITIRHRNLFLYMCCCLVLMVISGCYSPAKVVKYEPEDIIGPGKNKPIPEQPPVIQPKVEPQEEPEPVMIPEKRLALVIGNTNYQHVQSLTNPVNDARAMGMVLQRLGFEVIESENANYQQMRLAIERFGEELRNYQVGLFYYSGHGIQVNGSNYLMPTDANPKGENEVAVYCVDVGLILTKMETAGNTTNIMILDACRNNPFTKSWSKGFTKSGLAPILAPIESVIAYATAPETAAYEDKTGTHSLYTAALLQHIETPKINILQMFQRVRSTTVKFAKSRGYEQIPWESTSLTGNFYLKR